MWAIFFAVLLSLLFLILHARSTGVHRNGKRLPQPPGTLPLAGYGPWFLQPRYKLLEWLASIQPQMGLKTYEIPVPSLPPAVIINDPHNLEYVLKDNELFVKGKFFKSNSWDLFVNGILNADGELWRIQRKAGLRFFSNSNLQYFIDDVLPPLLETMNLRFDAAARTDVVLDLQEELLELTTRLMGKIAYDMEITPSMPFSKAFDYASGVTAKRFTNPLWRLFEIFTGKRFRAAVAEVKSFGQSVVKSTIEKRHPTAPPLPEREKAPLSSNLINSLLDHISSPDVVADAAMNFLSAGRDTTAQSLTWTLYSLFRNPDVHTSLLSALHEAFPDHKRADSLPVDFSSLTAPHAFPLANAIFAETLRLNPAVPFELKESTAASTLPDGTYLPKGAVVIWIPYALARSPSIWGDDASEFKPERWIDRQGDGALHLVTRSAFENPVFNAGPRMCIGKKLAEVLAIRVLCEIVWLWDLKEVQGKGEVNGQRVLGESLTAPMEGGLPVKVRRARTGSVDNQPG